MAIAINLRPGAISALDYDIAQGPALGNERSVYLTAKPSLFLGIATLSADGVVSYQYINSQLAIRLTGTVAKSASVNVVGTGTKFLTEIAVGDKIQIPGTAVETQEVATITDDLNLTVAVAFTNVATGQIGTNLAANPICAFVYTELKADAKPVITLGDLTGDLEPVAYALNQSFNFAATRGVELTGPGTNLITSADVPTITNAKRGSKVGFVQLPKLSDFIKVGCVKTRDITVPVKKSKSIPCGLDATRFNKPGMSSEGSLKITASDLGDDDGLNRFRGTKCCAMVVTEKEEKVTTARQFFTNYVPGQDVSNPDGDDEASLSAEGNFQHMITLVAPGS